MYQVYLFGTAGCHLCEDAEKLLQRVIVNNTVEFELCEIDIASDELLLERYEVLIPVIKRSDTGGELNWPFDSPQLMTFLK